MYSIVIQPLLTFAPDFPSLEALNPSTKLKEGAPKFRNSWPRPPKAPLTMVLRALTWWYVVGLPKSRGPHVDPKWQASCYEDTHRKDPELVEDSRSRGSWVCKAGDTLLASSSGCGAPRRRHCAAWPCWVQGREAKQMFRWIVGTYTQTI